MHIHHYEFICLYIILYLHHILYTCRNTEYKIIIPLHTMYNVKYFLKGTSVEVIGS